MSFGLIFFTVYLCKLNSLREGGGRPGPSPLSIIKVNISRGLIGLLLNF